MATKIGSGTYRLDETVTIQASASVVGKKESEGPLGKTFDKVFLDTTCGEKTWEQAESKLQKEALTIAMVKAGISAGQLNAVVAGDLLNQCTAATFGLMEMGVPFLGVYAACSTMTESITVGALLIDGGGFDKCGAVTSSHFCAAERQFRYPLEYGSVRTPTAQWTATASGAVVMQKGGTGVKISAVTPGIITDNGIKDQNNMGAAMAPAAASTIGRYFQDTGASPADFDYIVTGDLGYVGTELLLELLKLDGIDISMQHRDCGLMLYNRDDQQVAAGGSGCGCSASVLCGEFIPKLEKGECKRILMIATGALLSTTSVLQKQTIPCVAHLVEFEGVCK